MWTAHAVVCAFVSFISVAPCSSVRLSSSRQPHHRRHRHRLSQHHHRWHQHRPDEDQDDAYAAQLFRHFVHEEIRRPVKSRHHKHLSLALMKGPDFPVAHPIVRQVLDGMGGSMDKLKHKRQAQTEDQNRLEESEKEAMAHIPDAVMMQHDLVRMQADLRIKDEKLKRLEDEEGTLQGEHDKLHGKLEAAMDPRIFAKKEMLAHQESALTKTEKDLESWKVLHEQYRQSANDKLKERKRSLLALRQTEAAIRAAEEQHRVAEDTYEQSKRDARRSVEQFKYADVKYGAEQAKDSEETVLVRNDKESITKLQNVFKMEDQRIDQSLFFSKERFETRIKQAQAARVKTEEMLAAVKKRYGDWQEEEEGLSQKAAQEKEAYGKSSEAYATERRSVLHAAQDAAAAREVGDSDWGGWDDWAWSGGAKPGRSDEEVPVAP